ncbi:peptidase M16 domain-containing protein [Streptomyces lincolnensis]|uniref:Peptidase M16 domain-containing protein n=1 Tax=Streptomyces lincolnensis TaxID=1915 RepID=A0A1B1MHH3_STRLN|nr:M16 family metallopeptidase [Streptomyces lincolnensis]ANS68060.1 peptidase M16 domain-containing protein [Streptomyces lincolnensis]AXG53734.1 peptidase M16 domain-containing protein [Streptomyces lincolnensis]QMV09711.1 hypothetical protein GJU35_31370 [Streptomyces lincolnensis]
MTVPVSVPRGLPAPGPRSVVRHRLPNGLRVVLSPGRPGPRAAVAVHYGVGFRSERPGREGMAHLFEHLMFRGSESLPDGAFFDALHPLAGTANGTTHQDYTDYFQAVPAQALEQALFREADRMRAPRFTPAQLSAQLVEVTREIESMRDGRPYGGLPWPLLPQALFRTFAHAHDGYGDPGRLGRITVEDCAQFFETYYAPSNAVLTVVAPHSEDGLRALVERHFADVPARTGGAPATPPEPAPDGHRLLCRTDERVPRAAVAVGYRLPDPAGDLSAYAAHMVLAELTGRARPADGSPFEAPVSAGCGFFGALDARDPDALVVVTALPQGRSAEDFTRRLTGWWERQAAPRTREEPDTVARVAAALAARHRRDHADVQRRCRALGRLELLFGHAELADELPDMIARTTPAEVAAAAARLAGAYHATAVVTPARTDTATAAGQAPAPAPDPRRAPATGTADTRPTAPPAPNTGTLPVGRAIQLARTARGPRPLPRLGEPAVPALDGAREGVLANGLRVLAAPDRRGWLVELRLRTALGPWGWRRPREIAALLSAVDSATGATARAARLGGELRLSTDGQWADVSGWAPAEEFTALLAIVAELLTIRHPGDTADAFTGPALPRRSPENLMDEALRQHWLERYGPAVPGGSGVPDDPAPPPGPPLSLADAAFVVVGAVDPERVLTEAAHALGRLPSHSPAPVTATGEGVPTRVAPEVLVLRRPSDGAVRLTLCAPEPPRAGTSEPARYLTTALFGGHFGARLAERCRRLDRAGHVVFAARDTVAGRARALVRVTAPRAALAAAVDDVREEAAALAAVPPGDEELEVVRRYCAAQLLTAFDSPGLLADALRHTVVSGRGLEWVVRRPALLGEVSGEEVSAAAHALFVPVTDTLVVLGDVEPADVTRELS